nr:MAG TPA: hypothetical protein [Caudoviricetes sp.]
MLIRYKPFTFARCFLCLLCSLFYFSQKSKQKSFIDIRSTLEFLLYRLNTFLS